MMGLSGTRVLELRSASLKCWLGTGRAYIISHDKLISLGQFVRSIVSICVLQSFSLEMHGQCKDLTRACVGIRINIEYMYRSTRVSTIVDYPLLFGWIGACGVELRPYSQGIYKLFCVLPSVSSLMPCTIRSSLLPSAAGLACFVFAGELNPNALVS
jgi:hypothetical protein